MGLQICLLAGALFCLAAGYPSGAPDGACDSMIPGHPQSNATGTPPFAIQLTSKKYTAGAKLPGQIYSPSGASFRGFLLEVRPVNGNKAPLGSFAGFDSSLAHTVCGTGDTQGLTHSDASDKTMVNFTWTAPGQSAGDVKFQLTVVQSYSPSVYWTGILSDVVSPSLY